MGVFQNNLMGAAAAAASAGGGDFYSHQIANSLRNSAAQDGTLEWTAGTPTSSTTMTMSYWVKRYDNSTDGAANNIFVTGTGGAAYIIIGMHANTWNMQANGGSWGAGEMKPNALYRDTSAWYHHVLRIDTTESTQADRIRQYVNGERITSYNTESLTGNLTSSESLSYINESGVVQAWGGLSGKGHGTEGADLQMAEIVFCDGQSYGPDSFGETKNGVWIPKDPSGLTFGNNGYYLNFASSGDLGNDVSGNNNDFTPANLSAHDQMLDSPTFNSDSNGGNFCVMNPLNSGSNNTFSEGNLKVTNSSGGCTALGTMSLVTGHKWYFEGKVTGSGNNWIGIIEENGYTNSANTNSSIAGSGSFNTYLYGYNGYIYYGSSSTATGASITTNDIIGVLVDLESATNTIQFYKNGSAQGSAFNLTGTGINYTPMSDRGSGSGDGFWFNFGQEGTFGTGSGGGNSDATGYGSFYYDDGAAAKALCTGNLPTADAVDPAQTDDDYPQKLFSPTIWTGDGNTSRAITGVGFQPDWLWFKNRSSAYSHRLYDTSRGIASNGGKRLFSNTDGVENNQTSGQDISAVGTDGFTLGASSNLYTNDTNSGGLQVAWTWRANGGTTSSNATGDITSTVQADPSGGFSIVTYTGSGTAGDTIGHGLSTTPDMIMIKNRSSVDSWAVYHSSLGNTIHIVLDTDAAQVTSSAYWNSTSPTSSVFTVGTGDALNQNTKNYVAYCFANIEGYCKVGSYVGNANDDGAFVYTGFKPAFFMCKPIVTGNWRIQDNKRTPFNVADKTLYPNHSDAEESNSSNEIDLLSNGVKMRASDSNYNQATTFVYLAMAKNPFKYATAR